MSGLLIMILGVWGGLIPFIGPYFHYAFGGYQTWHFTSERLWLNIVPGAVAVIGGFMLLTASTRVGGLTAGWLALAAGAWFAVGPVVSILWHHSIYAIGTPAGGHTRQMLEWLGYFYGLGVVIVALAAFAMGRYFSRPRVVTEAAAVADDAVADRGVVAGRHGRAADRAAIADEEAVAARRAPVAEETRGPVAAEEERHAPIADEETRAPIADEETRAPAAGYQGRAPIADEEARGPVEAGESPTTAYETRAPLAEERDPVADGPNAGAGAVPEGTAYPGETQPRRRSGGLMGLFRRS
jgi:hypothetical protein